MTNNQIVEELISTGFVPHYVYKRCVNKPCLDDIIQDTYLILLESKEIKRIYDEQGINGIRRFAAGVVFRSISNKGLAFRRYFRPYAEVQNWDDVDDERRDLETI